ncbi:MAG: TlpA family protein disulfide reductase [Alloprevotella sp.]|nr:TlpA family protein disulfide reductase [Alloprevotella sp.]
MNLNLPHAADDSAFLADVLSQNRYAISHSADYREAYNPHYRIVRRDIFERELKHLLEPYQKADSNGYIVFDGDMCPDFEVALTDGRRVRMQDLRGKVVMLQFTASWCGVCRREMPFIERDIWQRHKDDDRFVLIGIDRDEPLQKVLRFAQTTGITYPLALDPGADVYALFALRNSGITRNVLVGPDGRIIQRTRLYDENEFRSLVQTIDAALAKPVD